MHTTGTFEEEGRQAARNFAEAARQARVQRIIYLGGLADRNGELSPHLRSRYEVGDLLRSAGVQVIEFRASIVIGSGSLSFEMIRALVGRFIKLGVLVPDLPAASVSVRRDAPWFGRHLSARARRCRERGMRRGVSLTVFLTLSLPTFFAAKRAMIFPST
jgi:uncharacterized protein YbjT (DUF2867 family)